jgi:hypothetical protein
VGFDCYCRELARLLQAIFRAALLPHPSVNPKTYPASALQFAITAAAPLAIFVAYHLVGCVSIPNDMLAKKIHNLHSYSDAL